MLEVRFFRDRGGHRIAYADEGHGPLLVFPSWWVSHLERDADDPAYRRFFAALAAHFRVVRYDRQPKSVCLVSCRASSLNAAF